MTIRQTVISGVCVLETKPVQDERGVFYRAYCDEAFTPVLGKRPIRQVNVSRTLAVGALRGLHFQHPPAAEIKIIHCLAGRVWDVALDLRQGSPTFLKWQAQELCAGDALFFSVPEGCAHGFQVLEANSQLLYFHTAPYCKESEGGIRYNDPLLKIEWPLPISSVSERDQNHPVIDSSFKGIRL